MKKVLLSILLSVTVTILMSIIYYNNKFKKRTIDDLKYCSKIQALNYLVTSNKSKNEIRKMLLEQSLDFIDANNQDISYFCEFWNIDEIKETASKQIDKKLIDKLNSTCK